MENGYEASGLRSCAPALFPLSGLVSFLKENDLLAVHLEHVSPALLSGLLSLIFTIRLVFGDLRRRRGSILDLTLKSFSARAQQLLAFLRRMNQLRVAKRAASTPRGCLSGHLHIRFGKK